MFIGCRVFWEVIGLEVDIFKLWILLCFRVDVVLSLVIMEWLVLDFKYLDISFDIYMGEGLIILKFDDKVKIFFDVFDVLLEE